MSTEATSQKRFNVLAGAQLLQLRLPERFWPGWCLGLGYGLASSLWIWGTLPSEWLAIPTLPTGAALIGTTWLGMAILVGLPFGAWAWLRGRLPPSARPLLAPVAVTVAWSLHPLPLFAPGYLLAYTPLELLAHLGGVHILTGCFFLFLELFSPARLSERSGLALLCAALWYLPPRAMPALSRPEHHLKLFILQPAAARPGRLAYQSAHRLLKQLPADAFVVLPEGVFQTPAQSADWQRALANRTAVWGEIRPGALGLRNTLVALTPTANLFTYDKRHLAPGGEWLGPAGIDWLMHRLTGLAPYVAGQSTGLWLSPFGPVAVALCYDIAWPLEYPARFALVLSNDDWLGSGFLWLRDRIERIRAIELGIPILRVANRRSRLSYPDRPARQFPNAPGIFSVDLAY
ncbi:apolipoprotein N-acyltransferase [Gloeobacter kilaueensis]|uniref:Apolipoprotein N-acyltransferase n=1 Tax=Gloeobacter kilaueensis (strain ATCC BAA-2537 / CCAP 1431/1 / ULC 316 / JS1) TaxID=1183438 RepID=U5QGB2_GLOK1|nr:apolipoprotein N-acyltransferase [Gloeobacter kilaueensis]AGY58007.1 apolipoprotein N-acyltransferase [Gloeobacter kilaueensis JS1]